VGEVAASFLTVKREVNTGIITEVYRREVAGDCNASYLTALLKLVTFNIHIRSPK